MLRSDYAARRRLYGSKSEFPEAGIVAVHKAQKAPPHPALRGRVGRRFDRYLVEGNFVRVPSKLFPTHILLPSKAST